MKKTIFNVFVTMRSQEQCDRMKAVCLENGLPIWDAKIAFDYDYYFIYNHRDKGFAIYGGNLDYTQVTEAEFLELLKEYKLNK